MTDIPVHRVGRFEVVSLPDPRVKTLDGRQVANGQRLYQRYTPERLLEYEVIEEVAFWNPDRRCWEVLLAGPTLPIVSRDPRDFVADWQEWEAAWQKRHAGAQPAYRRANGKPKPKEKTDGDTAEGVAGRRGPGSAVRADAPRAGHGG